LSNRIFKIAVYTATRAEYGLLRWVMDAIDQEPTFRLQVIVSGTHLSEKFGSTISSIEADGWKIDKSIETLKSQNSDSSSSACDAVALGISGIAKALEELRPDLLVVMGDRYELFSIMTVCLLMQTPIAHISGGEITEGAIDDQIRHAMTKCAHLHFVASKEFERRLIQMGEESWRITISGEPGLDAVSRTDFLSRLELEEDLQIDLSRDTALVTYHPVTLELSNIKSQISNLLEAMTISKLQYVITYPNSDPGHDVIISAVEKFTDQYTRGVVFVKSLGQKRYLSLMREVKMMIGNSSSGIVEAPSFNVPFVNIGNRQAGRTFANNVIHSGYSTRSIVNATNKALNYKNLIEANPYGRENASDRVVSKLKEALSTKTTQELLKKKFVDL
jgi:GDP/UDP-N,N'-diacetylbacillosamine 2-epimerase (hydrolysing)